MRRLRLALVSPLPPAQTGIADYTAELLPYLARLADLVLYTVAPEQVDTTVRDRYDVRPIARCGHERWAHDLTLYQLGNSRHHIEAYQAAIRYPGIVILHEYSLHNLIAGMTLERGDLVGYARELAYANGALGLVQARAVGDGRQPPPFLDVPLNRRLLDSSLGVIVHSHYVRSLLERDGVARPMAVIPAPIGLPGGVPRRRSIAGWPDDAIVFSSGGHVTDFKRIDRALRVFARLHAAVPQARYLIVGDWRSTGVDLPGLIADLSLAGLVHCTGYVDDLQEFLAWLATGDVVVNLRYPTVGETSATALRALALGRPLIVSGHGWYQELPDHVCVKVAPGDDEALLAAMLALAGDEERRYDMGRRAAAYAAATHGLSQAAQAYLDFIACVLGALARPGSGRSQ